METRLFIPKMLDLIINIWQSVEYKYTKAIYKRFQGCKNRDLLKRSPIKTYRSISLIIYLSNPL